MGKHFLVLGEKRENVPGRTTPVSAQRLIMNQLPKSLQKALLPLPRGVPRVVTLDVSSERKWVQMWVRAIGEEFISIISSSIVKNFFF